MVAIHRFLGVEELVFDPAHGYVTSPLFSPVVLASIRLLLGFYALVTLIFELAWDGTHFPEDLDSYFSYFTHLSYIGLCSYFFAAGVQTLFYARSGQTSYPLQYWPKFLQALHVLLFATIATFPIIVTAVFWGLLSSPDTMSTTYSAWGNISVHAMNLIFAILEVFLTNIPLMPWMALPCNIVFLAGYLGVAYITYGTQGFYTYSFLDPVKQGPYLAAYIVGIAVGEVIIFSIVRGLIILRMRLCQRLRKTAPYEDKVREPSSPEVEQCELDPVTSREKKTMSLV
ncbi:uncharacterized protein SCHCODRAFT_01129121 [Schizophyllum commune H4-8]|uniref:Uncharacterized protein n=1 Tax=Schizophyllum commune (strain H4-8 / FGSC 9210) TaxID=578458 RepID=D8Q9C7_SCHCM|nr:uncharacterized protein SCHCODRAFT_01129121 [Schizophyllum commune H4-8]KAI5890464.1 hypothetical protein SCHCODRAFT_01129121 [Schizophyllum commune H4-8]